ncbi:MAG: ISNCY family transposase [Candidatus Woesearchaeota archaeon]
MVLHSKKARAAVARLKRIVDEYKEEQPEKKRDWKTYEQRHYVRIKACFTELSPLVKEAVESIKIVKTEKRGNEPKLSLEQKINMLLLKQLCIKSNRNMAGMVVLFTCLTSIDISYKTIERLYSDHLVQIALYNLHILLLKKKGIKDIDCAGDGTGYTLLIKEHYASYAQKLKDHAKENASDKKKIKKKKKKEKKKIKCIYSFTIIDIKSRMYIAYGTSLKSEQEAFFEAVKMLQAIDVEIKSMRLDRYFSAEYYVNLLLEQIGDIKFFIVPKINITNIGLGEWGKMVTRFVEDTKLFLKDYFQRNQSESGFSEDKKRTGWKIFQKRADRIDTANAGICIWHNLFWYGD